MSIRLPQEVQTQKVKTLPDDLKKLAEELLGAKFGEEVIEETHNPFPGQHEFAQAVGIRPDDFFIEPPMGNRRGAGHRDIGEVRVRVEPWSRDRIAEVEIAYPSYEVLMTAFQMLRENYVSPRETEIIMHPDFYHFLMRDREVAMSYQSRDDAYRHRGRTGVKDPDGYMFGCAVYVTPKVRHAVITVRF